MQPEPGGNVSHTLLIQGQGQGQLTHLVFKTWNSPAGSFGTCQSEGALLYR